MIYNSFNLIQITSSQKRYDWFYEIPWSIFSRQSSVASLMPGSMGSNLE